MNFNGYRILFYSTLLIAMSLIVSACEATIPETVTVKETVVVGPAGAFEQKVTV